MVNHIGQQLGTYRIVRYLNRGGFAKVYLGEHIYLENRQVAIKVLCTDKQLTEEDLKQFRREANIIADLKHPNIVHIWEFNIEEGIPFLVMDYAPNGTLRQQHPKGSIVPIANVLSYVKQLCGALWYAHGQKLIHRDVKPENMLLASDNNLLLSDFGIAVTAHSTTSQITENIVGTLPYMAPEQFQGKPLPASDQYSLGVVVYEWLSGALPFENVMQRMIDPPIPLHVRVPSISPAIEDVVLKALARNSQDRFETVKDFTLALEKAFLAQESTILPSLSSNSNESTELSSTQLMNATPSAGTILYILNYYSETVAWSPDSTCIAFGGRDGIVYGWNVLEKREVCKYKGHSATTAVLWLQNGNTILSAGAEGTIQQWDIKTNRRLLLYEGHTEYVTALALSPNGRYIISGSGDKKVFVWEVSTTKKILEINGQRSTISSVSWSHDNNFIAYCDGRAVQVWEVFKKQNIYNYYQATDRVAWSPHDDYIGSAKQSQQIQVWNPINGIQVCRYGKYPNLSAVAFTWSPDGKYIAASIQELNTNTLAGKTIDIWEVVSGSKQFNYEGHSQGIQDIAWSPNGKYIASCSWDGTVQIWKAI